MATTRRERKHWSELTAGQRVARVVIWVVVLSVSEVLYQLAAAPDLLSK